MSDYTERVNALREHADLIETSIELYGPSATRLLVYDLRDAAAAIEALQADMKTYGDTAFNEGYEMGFAAGEARAEKRMEPKRGKIVRCKDCMWSISCWYISTRSYAEWKDWYCADGEREVQE